MAVFAAAYLVYFLTWNSLYEVIALSACSVNSLTSLLTKSYDIVYIIKGFLANRASYFFIHFKILECLKTIRIEIRLCQAYLIDLAVLFLVNQVAFKKKKKKNQLNRLFSSDFSRSHTNFFLINFSIFMFNFFPRTSTRLTLLRGKKGELQTTNEMQGKN